ncbi:MAG TPA: transposase [Propionibacteriaceae bacterium]
MHDGPEAVAVLDAFHVVRLGTQVVDEMRRRVQQDTLAAAATTELRVSWAARHHQASSLPHFTTSRLLGPTAASNAL